LFYIILFIYLLYYGNLQGTRPILSLFANAQGASPFVIGLLVSCYALLPMLLAVTIGKWLDQYGARHMVIMGSSGLLVCLLIPIIYPSVVSLFFSQLGFGFSQLFITLSLQKTVGNWPGVRDKLIAAFTLTGSFGELAGPLLFGFTYEHYGFRVSLGISFFVILMALIAGLIIKPSYWKSGDSSIKGNTQVTGPAWKMLKQKNLLKVLIISGLVLYSKDLYMAFFPIYAHSKGLSPGTIGIILSIMGGMAMVVRLYQFHLVSKFGRGLVLTTTLIISGFCYVLVTGTGNFVFLTVLTGLLGAGLGLGHPLSLVYAMNLTPPERHGEVLGLRVTFNRTTQFFAPFLLGGIGGIAGVVPIFWVTGGILLFGAYFTHIKSSPIHELPKTTGTAVH